MKVNIVKHPLIQHKLTKLRDKQTNKKDFKENLENISKLMAFEVYKDIKLEEVKIETPMQSTIGYEIIEKINLYPILRAGIGMVSGFEEAIPNSRIGHIGMYRDKESLKPIQYLFKYPKDTEKDTYNIVIDPILATGNSAIAALDNLKKTKIENIKFVGLLASRESIELINKKHPDVEIFVVGIEKELNDNGYLLPGLGDVGDRFFGTK